eukprot:CAMPEP_0170072714 /NCGR_PEP_ID=MMETSP0019_2-20121128/10299_1 /TAXON_ID=98059 /ORGANISM="Dinobryon sp., Strain UTEXLB2267" /LENGTH=488 /DNA_ID=CAMNT_0010281855 /DNA_START=287 /DNA_END=1753 /DNA_ORIENTATION=-
MLEQLQLILRDLKVNARPAGISTAAEWAVSLRTSGKLTMNSNSFHSFLEVSAVNWWPTTTVASFPPVGSAESAICQPYVSARIDEILSCGGQVHQKKTIRMPGTTNYRQTTTSVVFESHPFDGHAVVSFSNRRPDIVCYYDERRGGSAITAIGDVKGCGPRNKDFLEDEVGHVLDMGTELMMKEQFSRTLLYCFLTDGYRFQYFKCSRNQHGEDISYEQSHVYNGEKAWQIFFGLLTCAVEDLGFVSFDVPNWQLVNSLGKGRISTVFSCRSTNSDKDICVIKIFRGDTKHLAMTEQSILTELNDINVENIPVFRELHVSVDFNALILTPLGTSVLPCTVHPYVSPGMIVTLLQVIRAVHKFGWIHRDIKPDNIFFDKIEGSRIVLNDWSSAVKVGSEYNFVGTLLFGDPPDMHGKHTPTTKLDLRSLVRTAFCLSKQRLPVVEDNVVAIQQYWEKVRIDHAPFAVAMNLADSSDYDALEEFFRTSWV